MAWETKYQVFLGIFFINFPNGLTWYYGNLSSYAASALRYYLGPEADVETVWLMSIFIGLWNAGLMLGGLLHRGMPRPRLIALAGVLVYDGAFALTTWTMRQSLALYVTSFGALTGLADGFIYAACMAFIPMWEKQRVGLAIAVSTSSLGAGALVINQVISRYVNPDNEIAATPDGNLMLFSQEKILERVPNVFLLLTVCNFFFHALGLALLKTKPEDEAKGGEKDETAQGYLKIEDSKSVKADDTASIVEGQEDAEDYNYCLSYTFGDEDIESTKSSFLEGGEGVYPHWWSFKTKCDSGSIDCFPVSRFIPRSSSEPLLPQCLECSKFGQSWEFCSVRGKMVTRRGSLPGSQMMSTTSITTASKSYDFHSEDQDGSSKKFKPWSKAIKTHQNHCVIFDATKTRVDGANVHHRNNNDAEVPTVKTSIVTVELKPAPYGSTYVRDVKETDFTGPAGGREFTSEKQTQPTALAQTRSFTPREMACSRMFFVLWVAQFTMDYNMAVLTNYYKLYGELYITDDHFLAFLGTVITATTIIPKLAWGWLLDRWGIKATIVFMTSSTAILACPWYFTAQIDRYLYSALTLGLCWCVCAFDSLAAAAVLVAFGPAHFNVNYGLVTSSSIFLNMVTPLGMRALVEFFGWAWLFLSVGILNFVVLLQTLFCIHA